MDYCLLLWACCKGSISPRLNPETNQTWTTVTVWNRQTNHFCTCQLCTCKWMRLMKDLCGESFVARVARGFVHLHHLKHGVSRFVRLTLETDTMKEIEALRSVRFVCAYARTKGSSISISAHQHIDNIYSMMKDEAVISRLLYRRRSNIHLTFISPDYFCNGLAGLDIYSRKL